MPPAMEAIVAFFTEATFIGLWIFGWDRLPSDGLSVLLLVSSALFRMLFPFEQLAVVQ